MNQSTSPAQLLPRAEIDRHIAEFPGLPPERKQEIADHFLSLPSDHHAAVFVVLTGDGATDAESRFVRGCFVGGQDAPPEEPLDSPAAA